MSRIKATLSVDYLWDIELDPEEEGRDPWDVIENRYSQGHLGSLDNHEFTAVVLIADDDGPFCFCGHEAGSHSFQCEACLVDEEHDVHPRHKFEVVA